MYDVNKNVDIYCSPSGDTASFTKRDYEIEEEKVNYYKLSCFSAQEASNKILLILFTGTQQTEVDFQGSGLDLFWGQGNKTNVEEYLNRLKSYRNITLDKLVIYPNSGCLWCGPLGISLCARFCSIMATS